jgi:hypothetical protein
MKAPFTVKGAGRSTNADLVGIISAEYLGLARLEAAQIQQL